MNNFCRKQLFSYTLLHFLVDFICIFNLVGVIMPRLNGKEEYVTCTLIYNFFAFAFPGLMGAFVDKINNDKFVAVAGVVLTVAGNIFLINPMAAIICQGVGNGLFHLGGGRSILIAQKQRHADCGIFVSSGAMGVFLGRTFAKTGSYQLKYYLIAALILFTLIWIIIGAKNEETRLQYGLHNIKPGVIPGIASVLLLLFVIILRGYYGHMIAYTWNRGVYVGFIFTMGIVLGKAFGGVMADRLGLKRAIYISLGLSMVTIPGSFNTPMLGVLSILLFNMTMPITLSMMSNILHGMEGFSFGILMLGLFIGGIPSLLKLGYPVRLDYWMIIILVISLLLLRLSIKLSDRKAAENR